MHKPKLILVIMDGWGYSTIKKGNAIYEAKTPTFDYLWENYAHTLLKSFGENVGLPWGSIGSSEVGHSSIGSGRLIHQELAKIDKEIENREFYKNPEMLKFIDESAKSKRPIHLIGLVSEGGVHSHLSHIFGILEMIKKRKFPYEIFIHAITDGRDTSPESAGQYIKSLEKKIGQIKINARIVTIAGRYFAMDRDSRWDRTQQAYLAMTSNIKSRDKSCSDAINNSYEKKISDEFIIPTIIDTNFKKSFLGRIFSEKTQTDENTRVQDKDNVLFFNTRPDRMRQIVELFLFKKETLSCNPLKDLNVLTLTTYDEYLPVHVAYPSVKVKNPLAKILSDHKIHQGHFAETEKYAHVTYFFNGGNPTPFPYETWNLVPSAKVSTYDKKPEMSAFEITDKVIKTIEKEKLDFVLINYANPDMVGHTGVFSSVVKAVEAVDKQLKRLLTYLPETTILITADHGNAECMIHPETGEIDKKHTVNPVPFIVVDEKHKRTDKKKRDQFSRWNFGRYNPNHFEILWIRRPKRYERR